MSMIATLRSLASVKISSVGDRAGVRNGVRNGVLPILLAAVLAAMPWSVAAHMALDPAASSLGFVSVKNGVIAEAHQFSRLSGSVGKKGLASLVIDLTSVDTNIGIRDERMRDFLFHTDRFASARVQVPVDMKAVMTLGAGDSLVQTIKGTLDLHGNSVELAAMVTITRLADGGVQVASRTPVIIQANSFGLLDGLAKLQELASLNAITPAVPVTFNLVFRPADG